MNGQDTRASSRLLIVVTRGNAVWGGSSDEFNTEWGFSPKQSFHWQIDDGTALLVINGCLNRRTPNEPIREACNGGPKERRFKIAAIFLHSPVVKEETNAQAAWVNAIEAELGIEGEIPESICRFYSSCGNGFATTDLLNQISENADVSVFAELIKRAMTGRAVLIDGLIQIQSDLLSMRLLMDCRRNGGPIPGAQDLARSIAERLGETRDRGRFAEWHDFIREREAIAKPVKESLALIDGLLSESGYAALSAEGVWSGFLTNDDWCFEPREDRVSTKLQQDFAKVARAIDVVRDAASTLPRRLPTSSEQARNEEKE